MKNLKTIFTIIIILIPVLFSFNFSTVSPGDYLALGGKDARGDALLPDTAGCTYKGFRLYGKIQVVDSWPDIKVKVVESFPDLKVKPVDNFPDDCGEWQFVDSWPDLKVQFVESFPDIKVKFVESFPGKP